MKRLLANNLAFHDQGPFHLEVDKGECVGIRGPSGAGKTLLLRAISDMDPHTGELFLDGVMATKMSGPEWRKQIGLLPAEGRWWRETVGEHFAAVPGELLRQLGLDERIMEWRVDRLSSGERQRLALLRIVSNRPKVLLLDEPTANLDEKNSKKVERLIATYRAEQEAAVVWVSHDTAQLERIAQRQLFLDNGCLEPVLT